MKTSTKIYPISREQKKEICDNMDKVKLLKKLIVSKSQEEKIDILHQKAIEEY